MTSLRRLLSDFGRTRTDHMTTIRKAFYTGAVRFDFKTFKRHRGFVVVYVVCSSLQHIAVVYENGNA